MIAVSSLTTPLKKELGSLFSTESHTGTDILRYLNSALNYIYNYRDWDWNRKVYTFVYSQIGMEATIPYMQKVYGTKLNGTSVFVIDNTDWFNMTDHTNMVGIYGDKFIAEETGTYQIMYMPSYTAITTGITEIDVPPNLIDCINYVALHYAYKDERDYEAAQRLLNAANAVLDKFDQRTGDQTPLQETRLGANYTF